MTTDTLNQTKTIPGTMDRPLHRTDYDNGQLTIVFTDAAHLADAWTFAYKHGKSDEFEHAIMRLIRSALGNAAPSREFSHQSYRAGEGMIVYPAQPGQEVKLTIQPDSTHTPSFLFRETPGLVGGLIFHSYDASWTIHT
jgi:hypothetical protein